MNLRFPYVFGLLCFATVAVHSQTLPAKRYAHFGIKVGGACERELRADTGNELKPCELFEYEKGLVLQIISEGDKISELSLYSRDDLSEDLLSPAQYLAFISRAHLTQSIGKRIVFGNSRLYTMARNNYWDLYEGAVVRRFYSYNRLSEKQYLSRVVILYPQAVTSRIERVRLFQVGSTKEAYIPLVHINSCSYLALDSSLSGGEERTFALIGPQNRIADGKCADLKLDLDSLPPR